MKPWRPYWKHLENIKDLLLADAGVTPFKSLTDTPDWIGGLPFTELVSCDHIFRAMIDNLDHEEEGECMPLQFFSGNSIRWQMILRVECALTFCKGHLWKRKEYDWFQTGEQIYSWLLIGLWYEDAIFWASRTFGSESPKSQLANDVRTRLWQGANSKIIGSN